MNTRIGYVSLATQMKVINTQTKIIWKTQYLYSLINVCNSIQQFISKLVEN